MAHHPNGLRGAIVAAVTAAAALSWPSPAPAGENCIAREKAVGVLARKYGESRRGFGLQAHDLIELYANLETGTWTALVTSPDGQACVVAFGEAWTETRPEPGGEAL